MLNTVAENKLYCVEFQNSEALSCLQDVSVEWQKQFFPPIRNIVESQPVDDKN